MLSGSRLQLSGKLQKWEHSSGYALSCSGAAVRFNIRDRGPPARLKPKPRLTRARGLWDLKYPVRCNREKRSRQAPPSSRSSSPRKSPWQPTILSIRITCIGRLLGGASCSIRGGHSWDPACEPRPAWDTSSPTLALTPSPFHRFSTCWRYPRVCITAAFGHLYVPALWTLFVNIAIISIMFPFNYPCTLVNFSRDK